MKEDLGEDMLLSLVVLLGHKRAGKDTIGDILEQDFRFRRLAIIDPLRQIVRSSTWEHLKERFPWVQIPSSLKKGDLILEDPVNKESERPILQWLGLELRRHNQWYLIDSVGQKIEQMVYEEPWKHRYSVVITDARYGSDIVGLRRFAQEWPYGLGGRVPLKDTFQLWRVFGKQDPGLDEKMHPSELAVELINPSLWDEKVLNLSTVQELREEVHKICRSRGIYATG